MRTKDSSTEYAPFVSCNAEKARLLPACDVCNVVRCRTSLWKWRARENQHYYFATLYGIRLLMACVCVLCARVSYSVRDIGLYIVTQCEIKISSLSYLGNICGGATYVCSSSRRQATHDESTDRDQSQHGALMHHGTALPDKSPRNTSI